MSRIKLQLAQWLEQAQPHLFVPSDFLPSNLLPTNDFVPGVIGHWVGWKATGYPASKSFVQDDTTLARLPPTTLVSNSEFYFDCLEKSITY